METRKGIVRKVRHTEHISGAVVNLSMLDISISKSHETEFEIDGIPIKLRSNINLEDGDEVIVAGKQVRDCFMCIACNNITKGVIDSPSILGGVIGTSVIIALGGLISVLPFDQPSIGNYVGYALLAMGLCGCLLVRRALAAFRAVRVPMPRLR